MYKIYKEKFPLNIFKPWTWYVFDSETLFSDHGREWTEEKASIKVNIALNKIEEKKDAWAKLTG